MHVSLNDNFYKLHFGRKNFQQKNVLNPDEIKLLDEAMALFYLRDESIFELGKLKEYDFEILKKTGIEFLSVPTVIEV